MNIMTGCLAATEGEVTVGDTISLRMRPRPSGALATCPSGLPSTWTGRLWNTSPLWDRPRGLTGSALEEQMRRVMAVTQIESVSNRLIKNLSKGYQQRVGIAQALLGDPEVVIPG